MQMKATSRVYANKYLTFEYHQASNRQFISREMLVQMMYLNPYENEPPALCYVEFSSKVASVVSPCILLFA
jgi:hypothetical protein